ncbi:MAG: PKD domain-containing protein [Candidatus Lutacidiplasmatales archaeon]
MRPLPPSSPARTRTDGRAIAVAALAVVLIALAPGLAFGSAPRASGGIVLTAAGVAPAAIGLSWTAPIGGAALFSNYEIDRSTNGSNGPWTPVASVTSFSATSHFETGVSAGAHYWWRVVMNETGFMPTISNVLAQTQPGTASLVAALAGPTSANLTWTNHAQYGTEVGFVSYTVLESANGGNFTSAAVQTVETEESTTVTGLQAGTAYLFEVRTADGCRNASNCGQFPAPSVTSTNSARVNTPGGLTATVVSAPATLVQGVHGSFACLGTGGTSPRLYDWNFGDGATAAGRNASHAYANVGSFLVTCRVHDVAGGSANATASVTVTSNGSTPGNRSGGPGGTRSTPGGGTTSPLATTSTPFGPVLTVVLGVLFVVAIVWLAIRVGRRRGSARSGSRGPPDGANGRAADAEGVAAAPMASTGEAAPPSPPRDLDDMMDQLDGLPSTGH